MGHTGFEHDRERRNFHRSQLYLIYPWQLKILSIKKIRTNSS